MKKSWNGKNGKNVPIQDGKKNLICNFFNNMHVFFTFHVLFHIHLETNDMVGNQENEKDFAKHVDALPYFAKLNSLLTVVTYI